MTRSIFGVLAVTLALAAVTLMTPRPAEAAPYWPWCSRYFDKSSNAESCAFSSFAQCMETVSGIGGYCFMNLYPPHPPPARSAAPRRPARG